MEKDFENAFALAASVNGFIPSPSRVLAPINMSAAGAVSAAGTRIFKRGAGGDVDITGWTAICINPSTNNMTRYFNEDATKTRTIYAGQDNIILLHPAVLQITITGLDARVEVEGM